MLNCALHCITLTVHWPQEEELARLVRIQQTEEEVKQFDQRVRPFLDSLQQNSK